MMDRMVKAKIPKIASNKTGASSSPRAPTSHRYEQSQRRGKQGYADPKRTSEMCARIVMVRLVQIVDDGKAMKCESVH
jgi:hypothetical protein